MSTTYRIGPTLQDGKAGIFIRVQNQQPFINVLRKTGLTILPKVWNQREQKGFWDKYKDNEEVHRLFDQLKAIRTAVEGRIALGKALSSDDVRQIVQDVIYKEIYEVE